MTLHKTHKSLRLTQYMRLAIFPVTVDGNKYSTFEKELASEMTKLMLPSIGKMRVVSVNLDHSLQKCPRPTIGSAHEPLALPINHQLCTPRKFRPMQPNDPTTNLVRLRNPPTNVGILQRTQVTLT